MPELREGGPFLCTLIMNLVLSMKLSDWWYDSENPSSAKFFWYERYTGQKCEGYVVYIGRLAISFLKNYEDDDDLFVF